MQKSVDYFSIKRKNIDFTIMILLCSIFLLYIHNLTGWLLNDDEGGYLYQIWRMSEGELPYRDFYSPQGALFLLTGYIIFKFCGTAVFWVRMSTVIVTMLTGYLIFLIGKKIYNYKIGISSLIFYLILPVIYSQARLYRSDAYAVFFSALGLFLFIKAWQSNRKYTFVFSGICYAISLGYKLSATFGVIALLAFVLYQSTTEKKYSFVMGSLMPFAISFFGATIFMVAAVSSMAPSFLTCVLGHHLKQPQIFNVIKHFKYFFMPNSNSCLFKDRAFWLIIFSFPATIRYLFQKRDLKKIFSFQTFAIAGFLLNPYIAQTGRYLLYFMPIAVLVSTASIYNLLKPNNRNTLTKLCGMVALFFILVKVYIPGLIKDRAFFAAKENDTLALAEYISKNTGEKEYVMSDYGDILFYAQRKTTPLMAGMSESAVINGVISPAKLIKELKSYPVKIILIHKSGGIPNGLAILFEDEFSPHHFATLINSSYGPQFLEYLKGNYRLTDTFNRTGQLFDIYIKVK